MYISIYIYKSWNLLQLNQECSTVQRVLIQSKYITKYAKIATNYLLL